VALRLSPKNNHVVEYAILNRSYGLAREGLVTYLDGNVLEFRPLG
jgi:hypothetical protein